MFSIKPGNWITPPNQLKNPAREEPGHLEPSRFAIIQARQSIFYSGLFLVLVHSCLALASKGLKGRFIFPLSAAATHGLVHAIGYTVFLDGRSFWSHRDYRSHPSRFVPNKFFAAFAMLLVAPYLASQVSKYVIKNPVSLKVSYFSAAISAYVISHLDGEKSYN